MKAPLLTLEDLAERSEDAYRKATLDVSAEAKVLLKIEGALWRIAYEIRRSEIRSSAIKEKT